MKKKLFVIITIIIFLSLCLLSGNYKIIKQLCKNIEETDNKLHDYIKILNSEIFTYDLKGQLLKHEKKHFEIYWNGNEWIENNRNNDTEEKCLHPFNIKDIHCFEYSIKSKGEDMLINVILKEKFKSENAEIGEYVISKKTKHIKKENLTLNKMPSKFIKSFKIVTKYKKFKNGLNLPYEMKNIICSKEIYGIGRKVIIITKYSYRKKPKKITKK